jgi:hypothetical protein
MNIQIIKNEVVRTGTVRHLKLTVDGKPLLAVYHHLYDSIAEEAIEDVEIIDGKMWSKPKRKKIERFISNEINKTK